MTTTAAAVVPPALSEQTISNAMIDDHLLPPSPAPVQLAESSCSEFSSDDSLDTCASRGYTVMATPSTPLPRTASSPSQVCGQRKLSTALVASTDSDHPILAGRPTIVANDNTMKTIDKPLPPPPPRSHQKHHRAVAPLPSSETKRSSGGRSGRFKVNRAFSAPLDTMAQKTRYRQEPPPLRLEAWSEPAAELFKVRGPNYMKDHKKIDSEPAAFRLFAVDLVRSSRPVYEGLCTLPNERVQMALQREKESGIKELPPFVFAVNLCVPGSGLVYHKVSYFAVDNLEEIKSDATPFGRLCNKFFFGSDDAFRNSSFKLIPRIVEGNFVVRKAVGSKPSILGKKISQHYIQNDRFFEIVVDIASDTVAQRIVKLSLGYTKTLVVDMMFLLEGIDEATLPERIMGGVRMKQIDFKEKDGHRVVA